MTGWAAVFDPVWSPEWLWLRYATLLRATVLLGLLSLAVVALRGASASARAALWAAALLALLPLPGLRALPLHWSAHVVPAPLAAPMMAIGATMVEQSSTAAVRVPWTTMVGVLWLFGTLFVAGRLILGWRAVGALAVSAVPETDAAWRADLTEARQVMGVTRPVRLLRAVTIGVPVTWGTLRPTVLLPADAAEWTAAHRQAVLLHEVAHVRRLDCLLAGLAHLACSLWWFHPGAWWAASQLRHERERACDERVLAAGVRPSDYAECLLQIASRADRFRASVPAVVGVGLMRRSELRTRLRAILDPPARRAGRQRFLPAAAVAGALLAALLVGSMRLAPRPHVLWIELESSSWSRRAWAAESIARFGDSGSLAALDAALAEERHPGVHALARFGTELRTRTGRTAAPFGWPPEPSQR